MKLATIALIAGVSAINVSSNLEATADPKEAALWYIDGFRGWHDGFYKAFYKTSSSEDNNGCFDDETINNMVTYGNIMMDPLSIFNNIANIESDFNLFADAAEIMENLSKCHFEGPAFDLLHMCNQDITTCSMTKLLENLTKNMFVLVGKATSMAESFKDFPAPENGDFKEQMSEFGDDFGTFGRTIFNFQKQ